MPVKIKFIVERDGSQLSVLTINPPRPREDAIQYIVASEVQPTIDQHNLTLAFSHPAGFDVYTN